MSDKLNILTSNIFRFVAGERPTADKFNAMNQYFSRSVENIARAIGDLYDRSGNSPLSNKWNPHENGNEYKELDIVTLGRLIGPASNLNPKMFGEDAQIVEEFTLSEEKEIQLSYRIKDDPISVFIGVTELTKIEFFDNWTEENIKYKVFPNKKSILLHPNLGFSGEIRVTYKTESKEVEGGVNYINASWNTIPDPNDEGIPSNRGITVTAESEWEYEIDLTSLEIKKQQSGALNLQSSDVTKLNEFNNMDSPAATENADQEVEPGEVIKKTYKLPKWWEGKFSEDINELPEGFIYLKNLNTKEIYLTATYGFSGRDMVYIKDANLCLDNEHRLILTGTDITTSIDDLRNKLFNHKHDGSFGEPLIRIQDIVGRYVAGDFGPSSIPGNEFPMYLHRKGYQTDTNVQNGNNAMLGDILMGNVEFDGISNTSIATDLSSHAIAFGSMNASILRSNGTLLIQNQTNNVNAGDIVVDSNGSTTLISNEILTLNQSFLDSNTINNVTFDQSQITITSSTYQSVSSLEERSFETLNEFIIGDELKNFNHPPYVNTTERLDGIYSGNEKNKAFPVEKKEAIARNLTVVIPGNQIRGINSNSIFRRSWVDGSNDQFHNVLDFQYGKSIKSEDLKERRPYFKIDFQPSKSNYYNIYPTPFYETLHDNSLPEKAEYGSCFGSIKVSQLNENFEYVPSFNQGIRTYVTTTPPTSDAVVEYGIDSNEIDVYYEIDEVEKLRRIFHHIPYFGNSFEFNFFKRRFVEADENKDYGLWNMNETELETGEEFLTWLEDTTTKDTNKEKVITFNSNVHTINNGYIYGNLTDQMQDNIQQYFIDNFHGGSIFAVTLMRNSFNQGFSDEDLYVYDKYWHPTNTPVVPNYNSVDITGLLQKAMEYEYSKGETDPTILTIDNQSFNFDLNVFITPYFLDDDSEYTDDLDVRNNFLWTSKNYGVKVAFIDRENKLKGGYDRTYHSWLVGSDHGSLEDNYFGTSIDYVLDKSNHDFRSDVDDRTAFLWNVLRVKANLHRLFLDNSEVNNNSFGPDEEIFKRILDGENGPALRFYLCWIPRGEEYPGIQTDFGLGIRGDFFDVDSGKSEHKIGFSVDGYGDQGWHPTSHVGGSDRLSDGKYKGIDESALFHDLVKQYRNDHMGLNVHYMIFPRYLDDLELKEERSFSFNSIHSSQDYLIQDTVVDKDRHFFGKFSTIRISSDPGGDEIEDIADWKEWIEFPSIILCYGNSSGSDGIERPDFEWSKIHYLDRLHPDITNRFPSKIKKTVRINGESVWTARTKIIDLSALLKIYFFRETIFKKYFYTQSYEFGRRKSVDDCLQQQHAAGRVEGMDNIWSDLQEWDQYAGYRDDIEHYFIERGLKTSSGGIQFNKSNDFYKLIYERDDDQTQFFKTVGVNFNLEIKEKFISEFDLIIDIDCIVEAEMLDRVNVNNA